MATKLAFNQIGGNVYNVLDAGIVGDGVTDVTADFNTLLTAVAAAGGGEVIVPKSSGSYMINALTSVQVGSNTVLTIEEGATLEAITNASPNYAVVQLTSVTDVVIQGKGHIKGEKDTHTGGSGEGGMCIRMDNCDRVRVLGLELSDGWGDGIYVGADPAGQSQYIEIDGCYVHDNRRNNISIVDGDSGIITNNLCHNAGSVNGVDINLEPGANENVTNWTVSNNVCYSSGVGIAAVTRYGPALATVRDITITGNVCRNMSQIGIAVGRMIGATVTGNACANNTESGISVSSGPHTTQLENQTGSQAVSRVFTFTGLTYTVGSGELFVTRNGVLQTITTDYTETSSTSITLTYDPAGGDAFQFTTINPAITSDISVTGNTCRNNTEHGIIIDAVNSNADLSNVIVSGNTCRSNDMDGIHLDKTSGQTCEDITVTGNVSKSNLGSGIYVNRCNDINLTGNTCTDNTTDGIEIDGSDADTFGFLISSNLLKNNGENGVQGFYFNKSAITGNKILGNGHYGIWSFDGHDSTITGNEISGNSQTTDATYDGIFLNRSDDCVVSANLIRHDGGTNQHAYGIQLDATAENNLVTGNNIVNSGRTANILDSSGTSTVNNNLS